MVGFLNGILRHQTRVSPSVRLGIGGLISRLMVDFLNGILIKTLNMC